MKELMRFVPYKKLSLMKKIGAVFLVLGFVFTSKALHLEQSKRWLVLGGNPNGVTPFAGSSSIFWNQKAEQAGSKLFILDVRTPFDDLGSRIPANFNNADELDKKLMDDSFDLIIFDRQSARYSAWDVSHLKTLYKKLKKNGRLIIEFELHPDYYQPSVPANSYKEYKRQYDLFLKKLTKKKALVNGLNCIGVMTPLVKEYFFTYSGMFHKHNLRILKKVFKSKVKVLSFDEGYPGIESKPLKDLYKGNSQLRCYYEATK